MVQFLLESISDAVWLIDPDTGTVVDCNDATVALLCCTSRGDLIGKRFEDLAAPEQKIEAATVEPGRPIAERFKSRGSRFNLKVRRFDGTEVTLEVSAATVGSDGEPVIVLVSRLPDKRKEFERALEDSEERFRRLNNSLENRVTERTLNLLQANDQLRRAEEKLRKRTEQVQKHRDALLELAQSDKSDLQRVLQNVCSLSAAALDVARVSYWSVKEKDAAICCEVLYRHNTKSFDWLSKGSLLRFDAYPAYFLVFACISAIFGSVVLYERDSFGLEYSFLFFVGFL
jgi:PAS domain-containing protein